MINSVLVEFDYTSDLDHPRFEYEKGYLVDKNHVLLVDEFKLIWLYDVLPSEDPVVFRRGNLALKLGVLSDSESEVNQVIKLIGFLNGVTAWQFLTCCFPFPNTDIDFELTERIG